jgi:hypothetical protein
MNPARAANAPAVMQETERAARAYLAMRADGPPRPEWVPGAAEAYVRAILACALLAQGRTGDAREALMWRDEHGGIHHLKARQEWELTRENIVIASAIYATAVCRSIEAREAADAFFAGKIGAEEFVRRYGTFAGMALGPPDSPEREKMVKLAAKNLAESCAPGEAGAKGRGELLRLLGEQVYNDAAAFLVRLPLPPDKGPRRAEEVWLAKVATKGITVYRYLIPDMLPVPLSSEQKAWQREQAFPVFKNARDRAPWYLPREAIERIDETRVARTGDEAIYDRLLSAQLEVVAWIDSR